MITVRGRFATYGEFWFDEEPTPAAAVDVALYRHRLTPVPVGRSDPVLSLISDLRLSEAELLRSFGDTNRYKIRRAANKDGVSNRFVSDPTQHLHEFCDFYDAFARQKSLPPAYRRHLSAASCAKQLVLTCATKDAVSLVWHAYIVDGNTACLLSSASHYRSKEREERALVARANRWLHWEDMRAFRALGFVRYDWGGLFEGATSPERTSINNFKREFGGEQTQLFSAAVPLSTRGKIYLPARLALNRLNRLRRERQIRNAAR